ncbi:MAG: TVP38/TMEM64 family protein [Acidaminococcaceae bacterium]
MGLVLVLLWWLHTSPLFFHPQSVEDVRSWVAGFGSWGPVVYIGLYALRPFLLFPSLILNLAAGLLFGPWWGIVYLVLGGLGSATTCFWCARLSGSKQSLLRRFGGKWGHRLDTYLSHEQGFIRMLWLRTVPIFPYDPVSVVAGCSSMSYVPYAAATLVGMLPGALAYNFLAEAFVGTGGLTVGIVLTTVAFGLPMAWWYWGGERSKM